MKLSRHTFHSSRHFQKLSKDEIHVCSKSYTRHQSYPFSTYVIMSIWILQRQVVIRKNFYFLCAHEYIYKSEKTCTGLLSVSMVRSTWKCNSENCFEFILIWIVFADWFSVGWNRYVNENLKKIKFSDTTNANQLFVIRFFLESQKKIRI